MIIDFDIANSRLSYTSQTDNEQTQTQLRFSFDDGWTGLIKTAVFVPSAKTAPLSICLDSENSCFATAEAAGDYKMYIVGTDSTENIAVTTNAVDVTLTQGNVIVIPPSTTAALIDELNADAASIKSDVSAAAQAAETLTKAAEDYETYKSEIDTAVAAKANQSDVDTINAVLSGAIKNKGDVKSLTIPLPVTDKSMLNCAYNVIDGFIPGTDGTIYVWAPFQYKMTLNHIKIYVDTTTNKYYLELSTDTDIPTQLYYTTSWGPKEFYNAPQTVAIMLNNTVQRFKYVGYSNTQTLYEKLLRFEWQSTPNSTDISTFRDALDWVYTADNVTASWSVAMNIDDNFVVTEHGFDIQSYKITNYVTPYELTQGLKGKVDKVTGKGLSTNDFTTALYNKLNNDYTKSQIDTKISALQDGKANVADVYTKTEIDEKTADKRKAIPHTTVSGNPITITDALADEQPLEMRVYGDGLGDSNNGKYEIPVKITGKNMFDISKVNSFVARDYTTSRNTYASISDGVVTSKIGSYGDLVIWKDTKIKIPAGTYTLSADCMADKDTGDKHVNIIVWNFTAKKLAGRSRVELSAYKQWERLSAEITLDQESEVAISIQGVGVAGDYTNLQIKIKNVQLEKGNVATEYEPYQEHTATAILDTPLSGSESVDFVSKKRNDETDITVNGDITLFDGTNDITCQTAAAPSKMEMSYYQNINNIIGETYTGKYDTIIDYTYTGEEAATELNILLTVEQLRKIKKYEKFFCYVKYNVSATTGTTSFWATATLNLCDKGTTTPLMYCGIFMRAANTIQKITADNTPITWIATTDKVRLPDSNDCITNVLDYGGTQYNLFNMATLLGGSSRAVSSVLYQYSETNYDWVMQLQSPAAMPFVNGMKFIMWGK